MHGRLKVKTTAEQEAEKRKERTEKSKKYLAGITKVFSHRDDPLSDLEGLSISSQLLMVNPDNLSLWNYRREFLLASKKNDSEDNPWQKMLEEELKVIEMCLLKNPKCYGAWHHREWVLCTISDPPWTQERDLCDQYLQYDERNFHCWDHRRIVVKGSQRDLKDELEFTQQLIEKNFSNYSAWHYRSKLLTILHPSEDDSPHPVEEGILLKELTRVVSAVFTDPSDQSPWFFLRWLLRKTDEATTLMQGGLASLYNGQQRHLIIVFKNPILPSDLKRITICVDGEVFSCTWKNFLGSCVWVTPMDDVSHDLTVSCTFEGHHAFTITAQEDDHLKWSSTLIKGPPPLTPSSRKSLEEIKEHLIDLDDLDPNNKWVLLSLVEVLDAIDSIGHLDKISGHIDQLVKIDFLRSGYYFDLWSKIRMGVSLSQFQEKGSFDFILRDCGLTRLVHPHYLVLAQKIDLTGNSVGFLDLDYFVACHELILDGNEVKTFKLTSQKLKLKILSLNNCKLESLDRINFIKNLLALEKLSIRGNLFSSEEEVMQTLQLWLPKLQDIYS